MSEHVAIREPEEPPGDDDVLLVVRPADQAGAEDDPAASQDLPDDTS